MSGAAVWVLVGLAVVLVLAVAVGALWWSRTSTLTRRVGSFACQLAEREAGPYRAGIAEYGRVRMFWWRRASLLPKAAAEWRRHGLVVLDRHALPVERRPGERADAVVVRCRVATAAGPRELWLRMSPAAYTGFASWIEATPTSVGAVI